MDQPHHPAAGAPSKHTPGASRTAIDRSRTPAGHNSERQPISRQRAAFRLATCACLAGD